MSGMSNVRYWLESHGYDPEDDRPCAVLFEAAKATDHTLTEEEIETLIRED